MTKLFKLGIFFNFLFLICRFEFSQAIVPDRNCLKRQCFEKLGCFSAQEFIDEFKDVMSSSNTIVESAQSLLTLRQLLSVCPISPKVMNVSFLLFTQKSGRSQTFGYNPSNKELKSSNFSPKRQTVMIIHGYADSYKECLNRDCPWMAKMRNNFLLNDYNVIAIDWSIPAFDINYFNSAFNTQIVGSIVAFFINRMIEVFGVKPENFHLVGHSLGAQVSGFAGKKFESGNKIRQISGLDPAGPGFSRNRLSRTDANLVLVVHTSAGILKNVDENIGENPIETLQLSGILGTRDPLGHFDFWPNGGNGQPGCEKLSREFFADIIRGGIRGLIDRGACSHYRAYDLPTEGLQLSKGDCQMVGYKCNSYEEFNDGKCADCGRNGLNCKPYDFNLKFWTNPNNWKNAIQTFPNNYYFKTSDSEPFCLFHYQIVVSMEGASEADQITITLNGQKKFKVVLKKPVNGFQSGKSYTQLYTDTKNLGQITEAMVGLNNNIKKNSRQSKKLRPLRKFKKMLNRFIRQTNNVKIKSIGIKYMSHIDERIRQKYSSELFPDNRNSENDDNDYVTYRLKQ